MSHNACSNDTLLCCCDVGCVCVCVCNLRGLKGHILHQVKPLHLDIRLKANKAVWLASPSIEPRSFDTTTSGIHKIVKSARNDITHSPFSLNDDTREFRLYWLAMVRISLVGSPAGMASPAGVIFIPSNFLEISSVGVGTC